MKRDEAITRWCPYSRVIVTAFRGAGAAAGVNRYSDAGSGEVEELTRCLADRCAVWVEESGDDGRCGLVFQPGSAAPPVGVSAPKPRTVKPTEPTHPVPEVDDELA